MIILWLKNTKLSDKARSALELMFPNATIFEFDENASSLVNAILFHTADIIAYQNGSLSPELVSEIKSRDRYLLHVIDFDFNFVKWELIENVRNENDL